MCCCVRDDGVMSKHWHSGLLLTLLFFCAAALQAENEPKPDLSGDWHLDAEHSDDADTLLRKMLKRHKKLFRAAPRTNGRSSATGPRAPLETGVIGDFGAEMTAKQQRRVLREIFTAARLKLSQTTRGAIVEVTYGEQQPRELAANLRGRIVTASGAEYQAAPLGETTAFWDRATLVVETLLPRGSVLVERFAVDEKTGRLRVTLRMQRGGRSILSLHREFVGNGPAQAARVAEQ